MDSHDRQNDWTVVAAIALIAFGVWFLLGNIFGSWWQEALQQAFRIAWPIAFIALGVLLYIGSSRGSGRVGKAGTRLYRSRDDRMIGGVMAGIGDYFGVDSTVVRVLFVILALVTGLWPAVLFYLIAMIAIPEAPAGSGVQPPVWPQSPQPPVSPPPPGGEWTRTGWPHTGNETVQTPPPPPASDAGDEAPPSAPGPA
ncbi:MAG TPA: PspC domain-containing protein [Coriobacteriia bacterium]|nr:PspC domain-containing protein [Coriobacteriia bacterium]